MPVIRDTQSPLGATFSTRTKAVSTAIQSRFIAPQTNDSVISNQQQPTATNSNQQQPKQSVLQSKAGSLHLKRMIVSLATNSNQQQPTATNSSWFHGGDPF